MRAQTFLLPILLSFLHPQSYGHSLAKPDTTEVIRSSLMYDAENCLKAYIGLGGGYPKNSGLSLTMVLKNNWGGSISYKHTNYNKVDRSGKTGGMFGPGAVPGDQLDEFSLCIVREFRSRNSKRVRYGLEGGPSFVEYERVDSYKLTSAWIFGTYYTARTTEYTTIGVALRAKIEFPVSQGFGFEIALYGNINIYRPHAGFELYITIGKVRDRIKPKKKNNNH